LTRAIEVGIGVFVGIGVSLLLRGAGATARFEAECALLLRRFARALRASAGGVALDPDAESATRVHLRGLAALSRAADIETRVLLRRRAGAQSVDPERHRKLACLVARIHQDCALLARSYAATPDPHADCVADALDRVADGWQHRRRLDHRPLDELTTADPMASGTLRFLVDDLRLLMRAGNGRLVAGRAPQT